jgi:glycosyltransferase involved in cell wall biosynthesis
MLVASETAVATSDGRSMNETAKMKVLMLVENTYPGDIRVFKQSQTLQQAGYQVNVIALRRKGQTRYQEIGGVRVFRIPRLTLFKKLGSKRNLLSRLVGAIQSLLGYVVEYVYFTAACLFVSVYIFVRWGFHVVHAHNPPDTLWVVGIFYKLFGVHFVFDHHDLSPELYLARYELPPSKAGATYKVLMAFEKISLWLSTVSIATNESYKAVQIQRGGKRPEEIFVVRNGPDLNRVRLVAPDQRLKSMNRCIFGYVGAMNPQDGLDYMLRSLHILLNKFGRKDFYCVAVGAGDSLDGLRKLVHELGLEDHVWFTGIVSDDDLMRYLSTSDICLDPNPSNPLNDVSTWIKVMEYMALGKPIVAFDLKETRFSASKAAVYVEPNNEEAFAKAICELMDDPARRREMGEFGIRRVDTDLKWDVVSTELLRAYETLQALKSRALLKA